MKASPEIQLQLLELADLDTELTRLDNRRRALPEAAEVDRIDTRDAELRDAIIAAQTSEKDLAREQAKAEADVEQVRNRSAKDRSRLDTGQVSSPRELESLQSEIASLEHRKAELEDIELEVMERREAAQKTVESLAAERAELATSRESVAARRDELLGGLGEQTGQAAHKRAAVVAGITDDVMALYERMHAQLGVGAAALRGGRCEGCHLTLNTVDLNRIRAAAPDEVLRCEECRRILVRTAESGL
ncbi:MAG: zinc ribbon domain-containing protein [Streptosporangiaceae bacterium]